MDGLRQKRDKPQFQKVLEESTVISKKPLIRRVNFPEECRLLKEWHDSSSLVFFDFQEPNELKHSVLWLAFPKISNGEAYLSHFSRNEFIKYHHDERFDEMVKSKILPIRDILASNKRNNRANRLYNRANRLSGFEQYLSNKRRRKRRF